MHQFILVLVAAALTLLPGITNAQSANSDGKQSAAAVVEASIGEIGFDGTVTLLEVMRADSTDKYRFVESEFNSLGYRLLGSGSVLEAQRIFALNTEMFPDSWNAWDSLGEAYFANRQMGEALRHYRRSLELHPGSENGQRMIRMIESTIADLEAETPHHSQYAAGEPTSLVGPYLGQTPPGVEPKVFAPGIVSINGNLEYAISFSPDGREFAFTRRPTAGGRTDNVVYGSQLGAEGWTAPETLSFAGTHSDYEPFYLPDGSGLLFGSFRPKAPDGSPRASPSIWRTRRIGETWETPEFFVDGSYVTATYDGSVFVSTERGVELVRHTNTADTEFLPVTGAFNSSIPGGHPYVSPDGSVVLYDASVDGGPVELLATFQTVEGSYGEAFRLNDVLDLRGPAFCPSMSPDGRYIFFATNMDIYWVSSEVLDLLREP